MISFDQLKFQFLKIVIAVRILIASMLCLTVLSISCFSTKVSAQQSTTRPHPAVVRVIVPLADGSANGSGTLVDVYGNRGLIITNAHVVRGAKGSIGVVFPNGYQSGATVLKVDKTWDLAALAIWKPDVQPVQLAVRAPQPGDKLRIAGYGSGLYRESSGRCTKYFSPVANEPKELVELNVTPRNGDSGGPIFNERNELSGVLFGGGNGYTMGSYSGRVQWFLASLTSLETPIESIAKKTVRPSSPTNSLKTLDWNQSARTYPTTPSANILSIRPRVANQVESDGSRQIASHRITRLPPVNVPANNPTTSSEFTPSFTTENRSSTATQLSKASPISKVPKQHGDKKPVANSMGEEEIQLIDLLGETPLDQAKSVLAAIGLIAVLLAVGGMLAERNETKSAVAEVEEE